MQEIMIEETKYILLENHNEGFNIDMLLEKYTDYFVPFDYIVGDWAYGKLRLKGFYKKENKNCTSINDYNNVNDYIKNNCAFECSYFILEKK